MDEHHPRPNCWRCHEPNPTALDFCAACAAIQPPDPTRNYFDCLGVPLSYDQDPSDLVRRHRKAQRTFHPDRFVSKSARERRLSLEHATALNDALRVLRDASLRAQYMLKLRGCDLEDESKQVSLSPMFLMEVMELREVIDELKGSDTHVERGQIERDVAQKYEAVLSGLSRGFSNNGTSTDDIAQGVAQLKYLKRILEELQRLGEGGI